MVPTHCCHTPGQVGSGLCTNWTPSSCLNKWSSVWWLQVMLRFYPNNPKVSINPFTGLLWMVQAWLWGSLSRARADIAVESWVSEFHACRRFGHLHWVPSHVLISSHQCLYSDTCLVEGIEGIYHWYFLLPNAFHSSWMDEYGVPVSFYEPAYLTVQ